jgi:hypothetical protein
LWCWGIGERFFITFDVFDFSHVSVLKLKVKLLKMCKGGIKVYSARDRGDGG